MEYGDIFSKIYQLQWGDFSENFASNLLEYLKEKSVSTVLDVGCGTGNLSRRLAREGFSVMGIDISPAMIHRAKESDSESKIEYRVQSAVDFKIRKKFDLITCTFSALNHLKDDDELKKCFANIRAHLNSSGLFIFDVSTRVMLRDHWDKWHMTTFKDDMFLKVDGNYIEADDKAFLRIFGFLKKEGTELFEKFDEKIFNRTYKMTNVVKYLNESGFPIVQHYEYFDFKKKVLKKDLEQKRRIFFIALAGD